MPLTAATDMAIRRQLRCRRRDRMPFVIGISVASISEVTPFHQGTCGKPDARLSRQHCSPPSGSAHDIQNLYHPRRTSPD